MYKKHIKIKVPVIPKTKEFLNKLRNVLMKENLYAAHWVDAVMGTAYSIMMGWKKRYVVGLAKKKKPKIKRRFARCKSTLMKVDYEKRTMRITIKPREYVTISYAEQWFVNKIKGWKVGAVILKDDEVIIPFKNKKKRKYRVNMIIAWDCNEQTIDGFFLKSDLYMLTSSRLRVMNTKADIRICVRISAEPRILFSSRVSFLCLVLL